jgi:hypothetical protein
MRERRRLLDQIVVDDCAGGLQGGAVDCELGQRPVGDNKR